MLSPTPARVWKPRRFIDAATRTTLGGFLAAYGSRMFLLFDIRQAPVGFVSGLEAISELGSLPPPTSDDEIVSTVVADSADLEISSDMGEQGLVRRTAAQIARRLANQERFVVSVGKRVENALASKITVGRTANNDVMLKHGSVSKFHASFDQRDGLLFVRDAESKNGTMVNNVRCSEWTEVRSGDIIVFGSIEAMLCNADALWHVLNERLAA